MTIVWGQEDAHQIHTFPSASFPPPHTQGHHSTPSPLCLESFFLSSEITNKKYENVDKHYERHLHSMRTEIQKQEGIRLNLSHGCTLGTAIYTNTLPVQNWDYTKPLKKVLFHFTSLSISGKCLCTSYVIYYYLAVSNVFIYNIHETSHQFSLRVGLFWGFWFLQTLQTAPSPI